MGKTTLVEELRRFFCVYSHVGGKWFDGFQDDLHDLLVFDEFCASIPITTINKVLDGQKCTLEIKGGSVIKSHRQPVMVLTNLEDYELYIGEKVNPSIRAAFLDRFEYIRLSPGDEPWRLIPFFTGEANLPPLVELAEDDMPAASSTLPPSSPPPELFGADGGIVFDSTAYYEMGYN